MRVRIFDTAKLDLVEGYRFYEEQAPGIGQYFLDSLYADIDSLMLYAGIHPIKFAIFHCLLAKRFPYAIYYTLEDDLASVYAVIDCRQHPKKIKERLLREKTRQLGDSGTERLWLDEAERRYHEYKKGDLSARDAMAAAAV